MANADTVNELSYTDGTGQVRIRMKRWVNFYKKNPANHYTSVVVVLVEWEGGKDRVHNHARDTGTAAGSTICWRSTTGRPPERLPERSDQVAR